MAVATGEALYPALFEPKVDQYTPTPGVYSIDLKVTDEERDRLIATGIKPKQKDANVFVFKRKPMTAKGNHMPAPTVVDENKHGWDSAIKIGNGSKVQVAYDTYEHQATDKYGLGKSLSAVMVKELVEYAGGSTGVDEFDAVVKEDVPF
jgi:hypothetical protein|tara:strand:- start:880 stop:1326 length:447 start_codon:yes stop_codon:yes gene_type:complete